MYVVIHSIPTEDNPLIVLSVHASQQAASTAAREAAEAFAEPLGIEVEHNAEHDAHIQDSFNALDDCFFVTNNLLAILAERM